MSRDVILRIGAKLILPFILLFAFYIHFHGDYAPGGGFQGGVIAAAAIILYALVFGLYAAKRAAPPAVIERLLPLGVLIFAGAGLPALFEGRRYLDYGAFGPADAHGHESAHAHEIGILIVEFGVLVTVFATMVTIFYVFSERGRR